MNKDLEQIWLSIEAWDRRNNTNDLGSCLCESATEQEIGHLLTRFNYCFPIDFLDSLRRHNGMKSWSRDLLDGCFLPCIDIIDQFDELKHVVDDLNQAAVNNTGQPYSMSIGTVSGPVKRDMFSDFWVPIHITDWSTTLLDFSPEKGGHLGQVIELNWEGDYVKVIANSYIEFMQLCANSL